MNRALIRLYLDARSACHRIRFSPHPPARMPAELAARFTLDSRIPTRRWYLHDAVTRPIRWTSRSAGSDPSWGAGISSPFGCWVGMAET